MNDDVIDLRDESRFVVREDDEEAQLKYRTRDGELILVHTEVPDALGGRGVGGRLVKAAVGRAAREGLTLVPVCKYARKWLEDHGGELAAVTIDWTPRLSA